MVQEWPNSEEDELCPNCGDFGNLDEVTGWCGLCTARHKFGIRAEIKECEQCPNYFEVKESTKFQVVCNSCKYRNWLESNEEELETYTESGYSSTEARELVRSDNRPICFVCHEPIFTAKSHALFCAKNEICREARKRFRKYRYYKNPLSKWDALELTLYEMRSIGRL